MTSHADASPLARDQRRPPGFIRPRKPVLSLTVPMGPGSIHELKHDGFSVVLDGEAVAHCPTGLPDYAAA
jgi:hypothetical protein